MFIYYISATLYIGTNRVPPTPYTDGDFETESYESAKAFGDIFHGFQFTT